MKSEKERNPSILVADWNEVNAMSLSRTLNLLHFYTDQTYTGQSVIHILQKIDYDIVFINHWMPDKSGYEIAKEIRELKENGYPIIYVLAPTVSSEVLKQYHEAGVNKVFERPLKLDQFLNDLRLYFPYLSLYITDADLKKDISSYHWSKIRLVFSEVNEIKINEGMKSSLANHNLFLQIMKSTYDEIDSFITMVYRYTDLEDNSDLKLRLHNLKSVFSYIGVVGLLETTKKIETKVKSGKYDDVKQQFGPYIDQLKTFMGNLKKALDDYNYLSELQDGEIDMFLQYNLGEGYEQCIQKTIYYIKRFEYDLILHELNKLIYRNNEHKHIFLKAAEEIKNFNYEGALEWIYQVDCRKDE